MYSAEMHGAAITDCMPVGEIKCLVIDGKDVAHYLLSKKGNRWNVTQVARTDHGTGPGWYETSPAWSVTSPEQGELLMSDIHREVTRIQYDSTSGPGSWDPAPEEAAHIRGGGRVVRRYLGDEQLPSLLD